MEALAFPWPVVTASPSRVRGWRGKLHVLQFAADAIAVSAAVAVTFAALSEPRQAAGGAGVRYIAIAPVVAAAWVIALEWSESRSYRVAGTGLEEYRRVIIASIGVFGLLAIIAYVLHVALSPALFITTLPLGLLFLLGARLITRQFLNRLRTQGRAMTSALLIGSATSLNALLSDLRQRSDAGYRATGVCLVGGGRVDSGERRLDRCYLDQVPALAACGHYGAVIISDGLTRDQIRDLVWRLESSPVELMFQPRLLSTSTRATVSC